MWGILAEVLGNSRLGWINKVSRVVQRGDRRFRFDIFVSAGIRSENVFKRLVRAQKTQGWLVRKHRSWEQRQRLRRLRGAAANPNVPANLRNHQIQPKGSLKFCTWNIQSVVNKRPELELFLRRSHMAVLALQETARSSEHGWPIRIRGYQCLEMPVMERQPGQRGLALLVRDDLVSYQIGEESPYLLVAKVTMADGDDLIVASVYVPPRGYAGRAVALRQIRKAAELWMRQRVDVKVVLMGDWNMSKTQLAKLLTRWNTTVPMVVNACSGSAVSWVGGRHWADLDHMVMSPEAALIFSRAAVDRSWDLSDHWPVGATCRASAGCPAGGHVPLGGVNTTQRWRVGKVRDEENSLIIAHHNIWDTLFIDEEAEVDVAEAPVEANLEAEQADAVDRGEHAFVDRDHQAARSPLPMYDIEPRHAFPMPMRGAHEAGITSDDGVSNSGIACHDGS